MRPYKLVVFDMDGVIFEHKNFWMELHKRLGTYEEGKELTRRYLKSDYAKLVEEVVGRLWRGKDATPYFELVKSLHYIQGADETLRELKAKGYKTAIISSGPRHAALRAQAECGVDYIHTHDIAIGDDNHFTGYYEWDLGDHDKTARLKIFVSQAGCTLEDAAFVGHDHNDISSLKAAGLGVAVKPENDEVAQAADVVISDIRKLVKTIEEHS